MFHSTHSPAESPHHQYLRPNVRIEEFSAGEEIYSTTEDEEVTETEEHIAYHAVHSRGAFTQPSYDKPLPIPSPTLSAQYSDSGSRHGSSLPPIPSLSSNASGRESPAMARGEENDIDDINSALFDDYLMCDDLLMPIPQTVNSSPHEDLNIPNQMQPDTKEFALHETAANFSDVEAAVMGGEFPSFSSYDEEAEISNVEIPLAVGLKRVHTPSSFLSDECIFDNKVARINDQNYSVDEYLWKKYRYDWRTRRSEPVEGHFFPQLFNSPRLQYLTVKHPPRPSKQNVTDLRKDWKVYRKYPIERYFNPQLFNAAHLDHVKIPLKRHEKKRMYEARMKSMGVEKDSSSATIRQDWQAPGACHNVEDHFESSLFDQRDEGSRLRDDWYVLRPIPVDKYANSTLISEKYCLKKDNNVHQMISRLHSACPRVYPKAIKKHYSSLREKLLDDWKVSRANDLLLYWDPTLFEEPVNWAMPHKMETDLGKRYRTDWKVHRKFDILEYWEPSIFDEQKKEAGNSPVVDLGAKYREDWKVERANDVLEYFLPEIFDEKLALEEKDYWDVFVTLFSIKSEEARKKHQNDTEVEKSHRKKRRHGRGKKGTQNVATRVLSTEEEKNEREEVVATEETKFTPDTLNVTTGVMSTEEERHEREGVVASEEIAAAPETLKFETSVLSTEEEKHGREGVLSIEETTFSPIMEGNKPAEVTISKEEDESRNVAPEVISLEHVMKDTRSHDSFIDPGSKYRLDWKVHRANDLLLYWDPSIFEEKIDLGSKYRVDWKVHRANDLLQYWNSKLFDLRSGLLMHATTQENSKTSVIENNAVDHGSENSLQKVPLAATYQTPHEPKEQTKSRVLETSSENVSQNGLANSDSLDDDNRPWLVAGRKKKNSPVSTDSGPDSNKKGSDFVSVSAVEQSEYNEDTEVKENTSQDQLVASSLSSIGENSDEEQMETVVTDNEEAKIANDEDEQEKESSDFAEGYNPPNESCQHQANALPPTPEISFIASPWSCLKEGATLSDKNRAELITTIQNEDGGLPPNLRPLLWKSLLGGNEANSSRDEFEALSGLISGKESEIQNDIMELSSSWDLSPSEIVDLTLLMSAIVNADPETGYIRALVPIAATLIKNLDADDAFAALETIQNHYNHRRNLQPSLGGCDLLLYQMEQLLLEHDPELALHLINVTVEPALYAQDWYLSLMAPFGVDLHEQVIDLFLLEGYSALHQMALTILIENRDELLASGDLASVMSVLEGDLLAVHPDWFSFDWAQVAASLYIPTEQLVKMEEEYFAQLHLMQENYKYAKLYALQEQNDTLYWQMRMLAEDVRQVCYSYEEMFSISLEMEEKNRFLLEAHFVDERRIKEMEREMSAMEQDYIEEIGQLKLSLNSRTGDHEG